MARNMHTERVWDGLACELGETGTCGACETARKGGSYDDGGERSHEHTHTLRLRFEPLHTKPSLPDAWASDAT